ncbi:MAG: hypothetical protein WCK59_04400 [Candidatus Falkowbacteria bacterium]
MKRKIVIILGVILIAYGVLLALGVVPDFGLDKTLRTSAGFASGLMGILTFTYLPEKEK